MNRVPYFNYIEERLAVLSTRIKSRGKLNVLDLHLHSENFYLHFLNKLYGWKLENENAVKQNVEAVDLIDHTNKYIVQVSATNTKQKIEKSLNKESLGHYVELGYTFKFVSISSDASDLRKKEFKNPHGIKFHPKDDIIDVVSILTYLSASKIEDISDIHSFIRQELGQEVNIEKLDTNLAAIINVLSKEKFSPEPSASVNSFEIERKISHNELTNLEWLIEDYSIYHPRLDKKYQEFDEEGANKSFSILQHMRKFYKEECGKSENSEIIFWQVAERVKTTIIKSTNYYEIPSEELEVCVDVLVVDAFIRCKIFENPADYHHAIT